MQATIRRLEEGQVALQQGQIAMQAAIQRLTEAQARTEERVGRVEEGQIAMQAAIRRLEEGQVALQHGQIAMQAAIQRLTEAQARTEERVGRLAEIQAHTDATVGTLAENIGFGLEDIARLLLPPYLHKHYGIQLAGPAGEELYRRFFPLPDQSPAEINLYGEGQRDGQRVVVLGESKARIGGSVVKDFADVLVQVEPLVKGEVWRVLFGYYIHPSAQPVAEEYHILLVASYQR
jgi:exonuclease VII small subunit